MTGAEALVRRIAENGYDTGMVAEARRIVDAQLQEAVWHSPLGGLIEAQRVTRQAYRTIEQAKAQNTHVPGNPYDVALSALNSPLAELDTLIAKLSA